MKLNIEPEWAREQYVTANFGLSHMILFRLREEGAIRTVSLRSEGMKQAARLYHIPSIRAYLARQEETEAVAAGAGQ